MNFKLYQIVKSDLLLEMYLTDFRNFTEFEIEDLELMK